MDTVTTPLTPASIDAERSVLGAVLLDPAQMLAVVEVLPPGHGEWFYDKANGLVYDAMLTLFDRQDPIDLVSLTDALHRRGQLDKVGGSVYLAELSESTVTAANAAHHARIVRDKSLYRAVINLSSNIQASAYEQDDLQDILGQAQDTILQIASRQSASSFTPMSTLSRAAIDEMERAGTHDLRGMPTGFHDLDQKLTGFQPSDLIILVARPGFGKTALAMQFAQAAASHPPRLPVAVFSLEMSKQQLSMRMVCSEARLDSQEVRRGFLSYQQSGRFVDAADRLSDLPILVDDTPSVSVLDIRARCKRLQMQGGLGMVVVDYLQLLLPSRRKDSRQQEVADISRDLKVLAKELNIPVLALSQLNRAVEQRGEKVPVLSDLRDSGGIEQDADVVMFIYRKDLCERENPDQSTDLIVAKQRNGPTGNIKLLFQKTYARFDPLANDHQYAMAAHLN
jgi:replicative DNA helicase